MSEVGVSNGNNEGVSMEVGFGVMTEVKETTPPIVVDSAAMDSASGSTEQLPLVSSPVPVLAEAVEAAIATESAKAAESGQDIQSANAAETAEVTQPAKAPEAVKTTKSTESATVTESAKATEVAESVKATESAKATESVKAAESAEVSESAQAPGPPLAPASEPDPQPAGETECSTEETAPVDEKLPAKDPDTQDANEDGTGGNSWMAGLVLNLELAPDSKRSSTGAESEDDPEVVVVVPEIAAVDIGVSKGDDGGSVSGDGGSGSEVRELSPTVLKKRKESIRAEMEAFLEDSEAEDVEEAVPDKGMGVEEDEGEGEEGSGDSASASAADLSLPSVVAPPRSPTDDTEFSARHAKRVIGSGVVLERKASISAGPVPELKNKSQFSAEDAAATISAGAISERARKLKEEQEALKQKHATERQDTDFTEIPNISKAGSVRGKADMYHQALGGGGSEKAAKPAPVSGRLRGDWTQRRESLEQFVVKYEAPEKPSATTATGAADAPTRYIPLPADGASSHPTKIRGSSSGSNNSGAPFQSQGNMTSTPTSVLSGDVGETASAGAGATGGRESGNASEVSIKVEGGQETEGGKGTRDAKEEARDETAQVDSVEHSGAEAVATGVASASAVATSSSSVNITTSNARGDDIAATDGGDDAEVLKGVNCAEMVATFPEGDASGAARTGNKALGDTWTTDAGSVALPAFNGEAKAVGVSGAIPAPAPIPTESQSDTGGCCTIS